MATETADILIIGGGLIGLSTAYELARRQAGTIVVLEKGSGVGQGSTGSSSACLRLRYSHLETMRMALYGQNRYRRWSDYTGLESARASMEQVGVLWMLGEDAATVTAERDRIRSIGAPAHSLTRDELTGRFPSLSTCPIPVDFDEGNEHECGETETFLFEDDGGYCTDPAGAAQDLLEACRRDGVDVRLKSRVSALRSQGGRVMGVDLTSGE
jgi:glycine/D-amino acid oxidase-like deaminating enzyme